ncbi:MAG: hypothetical protein KGI99_18485 [Bradyrhizobium sp.]|uniref:hypothetical protein n=1 Tax=Bradyrhizobium sp. TaxID=376 RepID=UPI001C28B2F8|nr:hypothetical protein [Bradyrhizobium sp.]MBU6464102.1 hypothetical protein [Pseudomonadota bacterium]MDE2069127.1 hypothetical protein [Bradyrhizobium sp.]
MPVMRYFLFVGAALLALLFVVSAELPSSPVVKATNTAADLPMIRIHSDRKWPERVVFDTSAKPVVVAPVQTASIAPAPPVPAQAADVPTTRLTARDAYAQLTPADLKKREAKPARKRRVARKRVSPPTMLVAQRPQFGFFANNIW